MGEFAGLVSYRVSRRVHQLSRHVTALSKISARTTYLTASRHRRDRVAAIFPEGGGNSKYVYVHNNYVIKLPMDATQASVVCLVASYVTAFRCFKITKNDDALLTSANALDTNGVGPNGQALLKLACQERALVFVTADRMLKTHLKGMGVW